jgi:anti-sigma28 factor (negative regulator of flagellin synthesis)
MAKTQAQRQQEARDAKLEQIQKDIESGSLVVRKMTKAEREKFPPRDEDDAKSARKRRR